MSSAATAAAVIAEKNYASRDLLQTHLQSVNGFLIEVINKKIYLL